MSNSIAETTSTPWYRVRIMWLIVGVPTVCVAGCLLTIYLAISNPDYLVKETVADSTESSQAQP